MLEKQYLRNIPIEEIKLNIKNPRKNDVSLEYVKNSIDKVGYISPIIVDENNLILAGHTRIKALKKRGDKTIPEVLKVSGLTEKQKKIFAVADNSAGQQSEWDFDLLKDFDLSFEELGNLGFESSDIDILSYNDKEEEQDYIPETPEKPIAKLGDIYKLGNHRIMCGDSTKREDVEKLMNVGKVDYDK